MTRIGELLFGTKRTKHPLDLSRDDHREKQIELEQKQSQLRGRKRDLQENIDELKERYFDARDAGNDQRAERLQRKAENVQDELDTVQTKLDTVDQMLTTVSNFLNVYELRALGEDEYWQRLRRMDRQELIEQFSKTKVETEDLLESIDVTATAGRDVIGDLADRTDRLHDDSRLGWDDEYERRSREQSTPDVFAAGDQQVDDRETRATDDTDGGEQALDEQEFDDLRLS